MRLDFFLLDFSVQLWSNMCIQANIGQMSACECYSYIQKSSKLNFDFFEHQHEIKLLLILRFIFLLVFTDATISDVSFILFV